MRQLHTFLAGQGMPTALEHDRREHIERFIFGTPQAEDLLEAEDVAAVDG